MTSSHALVVNVRDQTPTHIASLPDTASDARVTWREMMLVVVLFMAAALLRGALAIYGWPQLDSDQATLGLMSDDILWHSAHPIFFYGQYYLGALQAYIAAPFFWLLGPTNASLHLVTACQFLGFLVVLYLFTRTVYSPNIALLSVGLLAFGPAEALDQELRAGVGAQDTLFFGMVVLWLVVLRLRGRRSPWANLLLDAAIGLAAGLGFWSHLLVVPFLVAAGIALATDAIISWRGAMTRRAAAPWTARAGVRASVVGLGFILGCAPLIVANIASGGATFAATFTIAGVGGAGGGAHPGLLGHLVSLAEQVAETLLVDLPHLFGSASVCVNCPVWPLPHEHVAPLAALRAVLISLPFSLIAIALWALAARPLALDVWAAWRAGHQSTQQTASPDQRVAVRFSAEWWGRAMLVLVAALTVAEYTASTASYSLAPASDRYLIGLYACVPLVAEPLHRGWAYAYARFTHPRQPLRQSLFAYAAIVVTVAIACVNMAGLVTIARNLQDHQHYGVPAGTRDVHLLAFLAAHDVTRFYTMYWVCDKLMFEAREHIACAVLVDVNLDRHGYDRIPADRQLVKQSAHPAYVFDSQDAIDSPAVYQQIAALYAAGNARFQGYTQADIDGYHIYYFAKPTLSESGLPQANAEPTQQWAAGGRWRAIRPIHAKLADPTVLLPLAC